MVATKKTTTATKKATTTTRTRKAPVKKTSPKETSINIQKVDNGFIVDYFIEGTGNVTTVFEEKASDKLVKYLGEELAKAY
jgi:hypothetical protein